MRRLTAIPLLAALLGAAPTPVTITTDAVAHQRFAGFGASLVTDGRSSPEAIARLTASQRRLPNDLIWRDAGFRILRVWFHPPDYAPSPTARHDPTVFARAYLDTHRIADARDAGATTLLLAPDAVPDWMGDGHGRMTDAGVGAYADLLADFLSDMAARGVRFEATGVLNEPNDRPVKPTDVQWPTLVRRVRAALDARHLSHVAVVAPEATNCDAVAERTIDAIRGDPAAWAAVGGLATHSYGMAATVAMAHRAAGKGYWITEAGGLFDGEEDPGDDLQAASVAARFLNDVNHGATHWVYFIGHELADPRGNSDRMLVTAYAPFAVRPQQKYFALRQLSRAFDVGAAFRRCTSSLDGDMTYTYGPKPRVNAAVARDPDGGWTLGLADYTSDRLAGPSADPAFRDPKRTNVEALGGRPSQSFTVTVRVPELAKAGDVPFAARRSGRGKTDAVDVPALMRAGELSVELGPLDVVTLRSHPAQP